MPENKSEIGVNRPPLGDRVDGFHVASLTTELSSTVDALQSLQAQLWLEQRRSPDFATLHYGAGRDAAEVMAMLGKAFKETALHGGSSCRGVISGDGAAFGKDDAIGIFAIWDPDGQYGTATEPIADDGRAAAAKATRLALDRAGRPGEAPELVWLTSAPGHEEAVLDGIKDVIGRPALIFGGSSADNDGTGKWSQITAEGVTPDSIVVSVLFPSVPVSYSFENGYAPTDQVGIATRVAGRVLVEIDSRPASHVYSEWTGLPMHPDDEHVSILAQATMHPLGFKSASISGIPFHVLAHPSVAHVDGRLELFADIAEGEEIRLMTGSEDSLVNRAGRVASMSRAQLAGGKVSGALMIYCGGCMLAVSHRMNDVASGVRSALNDAPFLGIFTFGEQGETHTGDSEHGNLMISCISFGVNEAPDRSYT